MKMQIHHIAITVDDLEESKKFYIENFGFLLVKEFDKKDMEGKATLLRLGEVSIELWGLKDLQENRDDLMNLKIRDLMRFNLVNSTWK